MKDWYTKQEVAELLNISTNTVYLYSKQKKIHKIPDPYKMHRESRYRKDEVDQLAERRAKKPEGFSPSQVAKKLKVPIQTVYNMLNEGIISAEKIPYGDERFVYVISNDSMAAAYEYVKKANARKVRRNEYYDSKADLALFQRFHSDVLHDARLRKDTKDQWSFYIRHSGKWISLPEGKEKLGLRPAYDIHKEKMKYKGYSLIEMAKEHPQFYPLIDYLFINWGIENFRIREKGEFVILSIKAGQGPAHNLPFSMESILPFITEGTWVIDDDMLYIRSAYQTTTFVLQTDILEEIKQKATEENITMSQVIESLWLERNK